MNNTDNDSYISSNKSVSNKVLWISVSPGFFVDLDKIHKEKKNVNSVCHA